MVQFQFLDWNNKSEKITVSSIQGLTFKALDCLQIGESKWKTGLAA